MAARAAVKGRGALPPVGPMITTQNRAQTVFDINREWLIVAIRPNGKGEWSPVMSREDWKIFLDMTKDGTAATAQRRDPEGTVLLAKLRGPE